MKQICVFDIIEDKQKQGGAEVSMESMKVLNFTNNPDSEMKVKISRDFTSIVFVNGDENFILESRKMQKEQDIQQKLVGIQGKIVRYILCD